MSELDEITTKAMALPAKTRAELAELLIQSLEEPEDAELKAAWLAEIHRRDQQIRAGRKVTRPADEVLREAREHISLLNSTECRGYRHPLHPLGNNE